MTISRKELIDSVNDDNGLVELLAELLKIPSDNPPGDTPYVTVPRCTPWGASTRTSPSRTW